MTERKVCNKGSIYHVTDITLDDGMDIAIFSSWRTRIN